MNKHFEFVSEDIIKLHGHKLTRIRALVDLPLQFVRSGDLGGYIESECNLTDQAWVEGWACVYGNARISGYACVAGGARVYDNASVSDNARVFGSSHIFGDSRVSGKAYIGGTAQLSGSAHVSGNAYLSGNDQVSRGVIKSNADFITVGPAISSNRYTTAYRTMDQSICVTTGCFTGSLDEFEQAINETHVNNEIYKQQYLRFVQMIKLNFDV